MFSLVSLSNTVDVGGASRPTVDIGGCPRADDLPALGLGSGVTYGGALGINPGARWMRLLVEALEQRMPRPVEMHLRPIRQEMLVGARIFGDHGLAVMEAGGEGLTQDFSAPEFRVIGALSWAVNFQTMRLV